MKSLDNSDAFPSGDGFVVFACVFSDGTWGKITAVNLANCDCNAPALKRLDELEAAKERERQAAKARKQKEREKNKKKQRPVTVTDDKMPTDEEAEESYQETLFDQ